MKCALGWKLPWQVIMGSDHGSWADGEGGVPEQDWVEPFTVAAQCVIAPDTQVCAHSHIRTHSPHLHLGKLFTESESSLFGEAFPCSSDGCIHPFPLAFPSGWAWLNPGVSPRASTGPSAASPAPLCEPHCEPRHTQQPYADTFTGRLQGEHSPPEGPGRGPALPLTSSDLEKLVSFSEPVPSSVRQENKATFLISGLDN